MKQIYLKLKIQKWQTLALLFMFLWSAGFSQPKLNKDGREIRKMDKNKVDLLKSVNLLTNNNNLESDYCVPALSDGCHEGDVLTNVTLAGIDNSTDCNEGEDSYIFYDEIIGELGIGSTDNPFSVSTAGEYSAVMAAWIDFDQDGNFDDTTEKIFEGIIDDESENPDNLSGTFNVPGDALEGTTRLRVRLKYIYWEGGWDATTVDPCEDWDYGETEDYLVTLSGDGVVATCPPDITTNAEPGLCAKYINFDAPSHNLGPNVTITYRLTGATTKTIISNEYQDNSQANFNIGVTNVNIFVEQNDGDLTYECDFTVTLIDRDADWDIYFEDSDPHFYLDDDGELTVYPTDFLDLSLTEDDEKCLSALEFYFYVEGDYVESLTFDCADLDECVIFGTHWDYDIVAIDQNGWEQWLFGAQVYIENSAPVAQCTGDITLYLDTDGEVTLYPEDIDNNSWDECGIVDSWIGEIWWEDEDWVAEDVSSFTFDCTYSDWWYYVELVVEDEYGLTDNCWTWVKIEDNISPSIAAITDTTLYLNEFDGTVNLSASVYSSLLDDNCDVDDYSLSQSSFDCEDIGDNTITLWVDDDEGNTNERDFTVTVRDTFAPEVSCTDVTVYLEDVPNGTATIVAEGSYFPHSEPALVMEKSATQPGPSMENNDVVVTYWDNTDCLDFELSKSTFECGDVCEGTGCTTVTLTVTDADGNTAECTPTITVIDSSAPHVSLNNITVSLDGDGEYELTFAAIDDESWDNCGLDSLQLSDTTFTCEDLGVHTVTLTAWDASGNSASADCTVTILDEVKPVVVCNPLTVTLYNNGEYNLNDDDLAEIAAGTTDNCTPFDELVIDVSTKGFECIHVFEEEIPVTVTVTDASGNSASCETFIVVVDDIAPVVVCKDVDVYLDKNGNARVYPLLLNDGSVITPGYARTFNDLAGGSYDACGIDSAWVSQTTFGCGDVGQVEVTLYMIDPSYNIDSCTSIVTVHDTLAPEIADVADVEIEVEPGVCETEIDYPAIVITDKCGAELELTAGLGADGMFPLGVTTETWVATDDAGNTSSVSFNVIITTVNADPTLDAIDDVMAEEDTEPITVAISGISYGNDCETQSVAVKATSTNSDLVTDVEVVYTSGSETGEVILTIAPNMSGEAEVTVTVEVSVSETVSETFMVTVTPVNDAPFVVTPVTDQTVHASYVLKVPVSPVLGDIFDDMDDDELTFAIMAEGGATLPEWAMVEGDTLVCTPTIADTGCVNIIITAVDAGGLSVSDTFAVCVDGYPVSIGELGLDLFEVQMYPNPTRGIVNMEMSSGVYEVQLSVMDITGKVVLQKQYSASENITFDMSGKVSGMYFVKMNIDGNQIVKKLIVDRK